MLHVPLQDVGITRITAIWELEMKVIWEKSESEGSVSNFTRTFVFLRIKRMWS